MSFTDTLFNNVSVSGGSAAGASSAAPSGAFPGSGSNNSIQTIGGNPLDTAFLDALYTGGKLTPAQRDAILTGSDPSAYGLSAYDLNVLTVGRLGSRIPSSSLLPVVLAWAVASNYQAGQLVTYQPAGAPGVGLYQCLVTPPAGTLPTAVAYWQPLVPPTAAPIVAYTPAVAYQVGTIVTYQPSAGQGIGVYQCTVASPAGTLPTNTAYFLQIVSPGPQVLIDIDAANPAMGAVSAPASTITATQTTNGTALSAIIIPAGRRYRVIIGHVRLATYGSSMATDSVVNVFAQCAETANPLDGTASLVITPRWQQIASASNLALAAVSASTLLGRIRVELI